MAVDAVSYEDARERLDELWDGFGDDPVLGALGADDLVEVSDEIGDRLWDGGDLRPAEDAWAAGDDVEAEPC